MRHFIHLGNVLFFSKKNLSFSTIVTATGERVTIMTIKKNDGLPSRTFSSSFPLIMMGMINDDVTMVIL